MNGGFKYIVISLSLEWVNPINLIEGENPFFVSSKKFYLKDND